MPPVQNGDAPSKTSMVNLTICIWSFLFLQMFKSVLWWGILKQYRRDLNAQEFADWISKFYRKPVFWSGASECG